MKITKEHVNIISKMLDTNKDKYSLIKKEYKEKGLSDTRFHWDAWWRVFDCKNDNHRDFIEQIYKYANDENFNTALKRYFKSI